MNNDHDEHLIQQVDDLLEQGKPSDHAMINLLADSLAHERHLPQADVHFMNSLEDQLVVQLQNHQPPKEETPMLSMTAKVPLRTPSYSYLTWAAALIVVILMGSFVLTQPQRSQPALPSAVQVPTAEPTHTIIIATRNIQAGTTITDEMVGSISLSASDFDKLQSTQPDRLFFTDIKEVIGQTSTTAMFWFEPIEPIKLGQVPTCPKTDLQCVSVPKGMYTISLSLPMIPLDKVGLVAGDRVDVLASANNQLSVVVEDVLISSLQSGKVTLAASSWKQSILIWLWQNNLSYTLSLHQGETPVGSDELVDYSFTSPEPLPDGYKFHLIAGLLDSQGYQLVGSPFSLDNIQFTQRDKLMQFWFTNITVVSITNGTEVVINLPASDAANLDFLLKKGAKLEFIPQ